MKNGSSAPATRREILDADALGRTLAGIPGLLHGVSTLDATTYAGVAFLLSAVVLAASFAPASRASRVPPVEALRHQ